MIFQRKHNWIMCWLYTGTFGSFIGYLYYLYVDERKHYDPLDHGFDELGLHEIVSFTSVGNTPSRRVMEKLGMHRDPAEDFDHPSVPEGDRLRRHVLYRLSRDEHRARRRAGGASGPFDG